LGYINKSLKKCPRAFRALRRRCVRVLIDKRNDLKAYACDYQRKPACLQTACVCACVCACVHACVCVLIGFDRSIAWLEMKSLSCGATRWFAHFAPAFVSFTSGGSRTLVQDNEVITFCSVFFLFSLFTVTTTGLFLCFFLHITAIQQCNNTTYTHKHWMNTSYTSKVKASIANNKSMALSQKYKKNALIAAQVKKRRDI